jgi:hypothetical protein
MTRNAQLGVTVNAALYTAFVDVPHPGDKNIVVDQDTFDPEGADVVRAFTGMRWQDVSAEMVRRFKDALPLFTPEAFVFYLPAYMAACINAPHDIDVALDSVLFNLTPPMLESGWQRDFFEARVKEFNAPQVDAIRSFLALMHERELADWAHEGKIPPRERIGCAIDFWAAR